MYYSDLVFVLPALVLTLWASIRVKHTYKKFSRISSAAHLTGAEAARRILDAHGCTDVAIEPVSGELSDHYDPSANVVRLSRSVYTGDSVAAIGVAAHECGHAIQYAEGYAPIRLRARIIPVTNFSSQFAVPMVMLGIILGMYAESLFALAYAGVILFGFCVLFQLVTLPVEFNASRRALAILEEKDMLEPGELRGARRVLSAAAMTYVAALAASLLQLLRLLAVLQGNKKRR